MSVTLVSTYSKSLLFSICNKAFPSSGVWGSATLLRNSDPAKVILANPTTSIFTTEANHDLVLNSPIKLTGTLPAGLSAAVVYYVVVISPTEFKLKATKAGASLNFTTPGLNLFLVEQPLDSEDSLEVLINKEISSLGFVRPSISNLGAAIVHNEVISKPPKLVQFLNSSLDPVTYSYILYIEGGLTQPGSLVGESYILTKFSEPQILPPESTLGVMLTLSLSA